MFADTATAEPELEPTEHPLALVGLRLCCRMDAHMGYKIDQMGSEPDHPLANILSSISWISPKPTRSY